MKDPLDKDIPSGNGVAARLFIRLGHLTGEKRFFEIAKNCFNALQPIMERAPRGVESLLLALAHFYDTISPADVSAGPAERPDASARKKPVKAEAFVSKSAAAPGETVSVAIKLSIDKGWHINSNKPFQEYLIPMTLELQDSPAVSLGDVAFPLGRQVTLDIDPEPLSVYEETAWIMAPLKIAKTAQEGERTVDLSMRIQACSEEN